MAHTDVVILVDQNGRYRGRYKSKYDLDKLTTDIRWLLESGSWNLKNNILSSVIFWTEFLFLIKT